MKIPGNLTVSVNRTRRSSRTSSMEFINVGSAVVREMHIWFMLIRRMIIKLRESDFGALASLKNLG